MNPLNAITAKRQRLAVTTVSVLASLALGACSPTAQVPVIPSTPVAAVDTPRPDYPLALACAGIGGTSVLSLTVDTQGRPTGVRLLQGSGNDALDKAALERIPQWKFIAATRGGKPVVQTMQVPVNFKPPTVRPDECFQLDGQK